MKGCLEDLEAQTIAKDIEIIVVDSASEQNEKDIVADFQSRFDNIVYVRTEKKETIYAAWNRAIRHARGKYITNANVDDRHIQNALEKLSDVLDENEKVSLVYNDVAITTHENSTYGDAIISGFYLFSDFNRDRLLKQCFIGPQPLWRKSLHEKYGYFDPFYTSAGDYEYWLRIAKTEEFYHLPETLGLYLLSPGSAEHRNAQISAMEQYHSVKKHLPKEFNTVEELRKTFEKEIVITDKLSEFVFQIGDLFKKGDFTSVLEHLQSALKIFPNHPVLLNIMGMLYMRSERYEDARKEFAVAQTIYSSFLPAIHNHAIALNHLGRNFEAIFLIDAILKAVPTYLPAGRSLIKLYFQAGMDNKAIEVAKKYLEKAPFDNELKCLLAEYYGKKKDFHSATQMYSSLLAEVPDFLDIEEITLGNNWIPEKREEERTLTALEKFNSIINSGDVVKFLQEHEDWMDEDLRQVVIVKIDEAKKFQLKDVEVALSNLHEFIERVIQVKK